MARTSEASVRLTRLPVASTRSRRSALPWGSATRVHVKVIRISPVGIGVTRTGQTGRSVPITWAAAAMCLSGTLACGTRPVAAEHLPRAPSGETHQFAFLATVREPQVRERVPEQVRMKSSL